MPRKNGDSPATKTDLQALRLDMDRRFEGIDERFERIDKTLIRMGVEIVRTQADVRDIKAAMATKDDISRVLTAIDAFAKQTTDNRRTLLV